MFQKFLGFSGWKTFDPFNLSSLTYVVNVDVAAMLIHKEDRGKIHLVRKIGREQSPTITASNPFCWIMYYLIILVLAVFSFNQRSLWNACSHHISLQVTSLNLCMYLKTIYDIAWIKLQLACKTCKLWIGFANLFCVFYKLYPRCRAANPYWFDYFYEFASWYKHYVRIHVLLQFPSCLDNIFLKPIFSHLQSHPS